LPDDLRSLRRTQIIAAARAIVARRGLEALTIGELEKRLGYSRGVITYHFRNKDEIVDELLRSAIAEIDEATRARVAAASSRDARIAAVIRAVVQGFVSRVEAVRILVSFWGRLHAEPRIRAANARLYARYRAETAKLLGGRAGDAALATMIVGVVLGIAAQAYFDPRRVDVDAAVDEATRAVQARLRAR
jgi:AcrR family transcriptional regulator